MVQVRENKEFSQGQGKKAPPLDTLAQLGTKSLNKRARSKWYTQKVVKELLNTTDSPLKKQYKRAFYCNEELIQHDRNKMTSKFCNSRACNVCNRIRTAKLMNGYISPLMELGELEFVTLTEPNVKEYELEQTISSQIKKISNIFEVFRKRRKIQISGIRKLECTYSEERNDYHPHIHLLVNAGTGEQVIQEWLKRTPNAIRKAQNVRKADQNSFNELFKYTTKQFDIETGEEQGYLNINVRSLDVILRAMDRKRTFQTYGQIRKVKVSEEVEELQSQEYADLPDFQTMIWKWEKKDWYNKYKDALTNHKEPGIEIKMKNATNMKWTKREYEIHKKRQDSQKKIIDKRFDSNRIFDSERLKEIIKNKRNEMQLL